MSSVCRRKAATLFLGREAFREQIYTGGHESRASLVVVEDGVGLAGFVLGPMDGAAVEVAGVEQRHGAAFGFFAQCVFEAEIHHATGRDGHAQRGAARAGRISSSSS